MLVTKHFIHSTGVYIERGGNNLTYARTFGSSSIVRSTAGAYVLNFYQITSGVHNGNTSQDKVVGTAFNRIVYKLTSSTIRRSSALTGILIHTIYSFSLAGLLNREDTQKFKAIGCTMGAATYHFHSMTIDVNTRGETSVAMHSGRRIVLRAAYQGRHTDEQHQLEIVFHIYNSC